MYIECIGNVPENGEIDPFQLNAQLEEKVVMMRRDVEIHQTDNGWITDCGDVFDTASAALKFMKDGDHRKVENVASREIGGAMPDLLRDDFGRSLDFDLATEQVLRDRRIFR